MSKEWFYVENEQQKGSVTEDELRDVLRKGMIPEETLVWSEGMGDWMPIKNIAVAYAGFWIRVGATLIDTIILFIITFPLLITIYGKEYFDPTRNDLVAGPIDFLISWVMPVIFTITFFEYLYPY